MCSHGLYPLKLDITFFREGVGMGGGGSKVCAQKFVLSGV